MIAARVGLVEGIAQGDVVLPARIAEAFLNVARHPFVPVFYRREPGDLFVPWRSGDGSGDEAGWLAAVYSGASLITEIDGLHAENAPASGVRGVPTSSSTAPALMADMLDALDLRPDSRVLEVGTGSGYNAALLSWLTKGRVTTVDHTAHLVETARERLGTQGFSPDVIEGDAMHGWAANAPYDRLLASASVRRVPRAWIDQCSVGAVLVVPLKGTLAGGSIAWLKKLADGRAVGRLMHTPAAFMPLLSRGGGGSGGGIDDHAGDPTLLQEVGRRVSPLGERVSPLGGRILDDWTFSFFAQLHLAPGTVRSFDHRDGLHTTRLRAADGSTTTVTEVAPGAPVQVTWTGSHDLWADIEAAHDLWLTLNRPRREWFTVDVAPDDQHVHLRTPTGRTLTWTL
nr:methyltransferase domain-containing protein [Streptomyces sp. SID3343]